MNACEISAAVKCREAAFFRGYGDGGETAVCRLVKIDPSSWRKIKRGIKQLPRRNADPALALVAKLRPEHLPFFDQIRGRHFHLVAESRLAPQIRAILNKATLSPQ